MQRLVRIRGVSFRQTRLTNANFERVDLGGSDFSRSVGHKPNFDRANITKTNFRWAKYTQPSFRNCSASETTFKEVDFEKPLFTGTYGHMADFESACLIGADFTESSFTSAGFRKARMDSSTFSKANFHSSDFTAADLPDCRMDAADNMMDMGLRNLTLTRAVLPADWFRDIPPIRNLRETVLARIKECGGTLDMGTFHRCKTTHCIAGWITTVHPQGAILASLVGDSTAAALILAASGENIPDFYDVEGGNKRAMIWLETGVQPPPGEHDDDDADDLASVTAEY